MYQANAYWFDITNSFQVSFLFLTMGFQKVLYTLPTIRNPRCWCCRVMFAQFDRPEDRPNTLHWIFFQFWTATFIYLIGFSIIKEVGDYDLLASCGWISTISHGLGDGNHCAATNRIIGNGHVQQKERIFMKSCK